MLAGGLSRPDCQYTQMGFAQLQALTKSGRCAPLSAAADGLVVGEGAGLFLLKRLSDAQRDGDHIYATIAGIGLSNDRGANLLAPHTEGQLRAMQAAYAQAGWKPGDVDLIECHATGTPVGDAVELDSLHALWKEEQGRPQRCVLGSVKSNVGHLLTGAGGASLMKMLAAFEHQTLPPTANFVDPAPNLTRADSPFQVLASAKPWKRRDGQTPRRAAINAFGFGGINAHVLLEEVDGIGQMAQGQKDGHASVFSVPQPLATSHQPASPIAIVGMAARCGALTSLSEIAGRCFGQSVAERLAIEEVRAPIGAFRIPPLEWDEMLPQQQVMLQVAAAALDDAGCERSLGNRTGLCVGINLDPNTTNFHGRWSLEEYAPQWAERLGQSADASSLAAWVKDLREAFGPPLTANRVMGNLGGIVASRLAREFEVGGPSFTISSDETAGLQALQVAVRALQQEELDRALVGAIDLQHDVRLCPETTHNGRGPEPLGDAAVAFVLKRLVDAERDGDRVYAVVTEMRATTTPVDPFGTNVVATSNHVTADFGHCGAATGLLAALKSTLALAWGVQPPATSGDLHGSQPWLQDRTAGPRTQQTIVTGRDGTKVEVMLAAPTSPQQTTAAPLVALATGLFVFDGSSDTELREAIAACRELVATSANLGEAARRWYHQRRPDPQRPRAVSIVAQTPAEWDAQANRLLAQPMLSITPLSQPTNNNPQPTPPLAFVFPGSGNHFLGMGKELLAAFPQILQRQQRENDRLASQFQPDLIWNGPSTEAIGRDHKRMIFGQVALGTALCDWLTLFGVRPMAAIGYSLGESAALFGLRAWVDRDEMLRRMEASPLFGSDLVRPYDAARKAWQIPRDQDVPWLSGVVDRSAADVRAALARKTRVFLLIINTPTQCVIGGDRLQVEAVVRDLQANFVPFPAPSTVHCELLQPVAKAYVELHLMKTTPPPGVTFYSGATGQSYGLSEQSAAGAILAQARDTVDFPRVIEQVYADGVRLFVEIGPGASCTRMIDEILGDRPHAALALCPATADPVGQALRVLGTLIEHRVPVDLTALYGASQPAAPASSPRELVTPINPQPWQTRDFTALRTIRQQSPVVSPPSTVPPVPARPVTPVPPPRPVVITPAAAAPPAPQPLRFSESRAVSRPPVTATLPNSAPAPSTTVPTTTVVAGPAVVQRSASALDGMVPGFEAWLTERVAAHEAFLRFAQQAQTLAAEFATGAGFELIAKTQASAGDAVWLAPVTTLSPSPHRPLAPSSSTPVLLSPRTPAPLPIEPPRALDYAQCLEFAIGKIGNVLGPKFAPIDAFPTRVRLPDVPLMLVDRITAIEGEPLSMTHGRVVTEHDIHADDWYLDCGRIPTCLAVESGQADLFLSGWLGIDFETRGLAMYRLLDAVVTFHDALPGPGKTIRYDIRINRFFQQGSTYLFRFEFDATVDGQPLLTMRDGCAGFFTMAELAAGQGIIHTALDKQPRPGKRPSEWIDLVPMAVESYTDDQLAALRAGDLTTCFGAPFARLRLHAPVTLPSGRLNLVHRVLELNPTGGKYGLGTIKAEADIHPDDWFLTCHFCDDQVMPGTLMYECCLHTLRIYLLRMGWIGEAGEVAYEPVPGVKSRLKCRGQVLSSTKQVWYEVTLKEIGEEGLAANDARPSLYCLADALMYADGKPIVEITDMSVRLSGLSRARVESLWSEAKGTGVRESGSPGVEDNSTVRPVLQEPAALPHSPSPALPLARTPIFNTDRITAFAIGKPSEAFGDRYRVFDSERVIARLPGPPFQFLDRIVSIKDCEAWKLAAGGEIVAEYDVPPDAWYFAANRQPTMPFAVLLETALQPCGWLAGYLGSALTSDVDLSFRNLGGKATQFEEVTPQSGTLTTTVKITRVSQSAGMIIQHYDYDLRCDGRPVYVGNTYFGFFTKQALANQVGIRDAAVYQPTDAERARATSFPIPTEPPFPDERFRMVHRIDWLIPNGGPHGLGCLRGSVDVDPSFWFFQAHFYQDPVWPGSLGLESFLQVLKAYGVGRWSEKGENGAMTPSLSHLPSAISRFPAVLGAPHEWVYRGQVLPTDRHVTVDVVVTAVDDATRTVTADGFLTVDGRVIYQMKSFQLSFA